MSGSTKEGKGKERRSSQHRAKLHRYTFNHFALTKGDNTTAAVYGSLSYPFVPTQLVEGSLGPQPTSWICIISSLYLFLFHIIASSVDPHVVFFIPSAK